MGRSRYRRYHRRALVRRPVGPLLVPLCAVVLAAVIAIAAIVAAVAPPVLFGVGAVVVLRHLRRGQLRAAGWRRPASMPPTPMAPPAPMAPPVAPAQPGQDWPAAQARFAELRGEYGQFECDPLAVLRLPALADVTVPSTGRFVDAFAEAQALDTDGEPPPAHRARFATAVDQAWHAWHAARDAAERIRLAGIPEHERATVHRAIKLLTMARDSDHDAERLAAYAKARAELAKLDRGGTLRLPPAAAATLDAAARGQLPAGEAVG